MNKDWIGNSRSIYTVLGASNHTDKEREENDLYCTSPEAVEIWLRERKPELTNTILEPCAGLGHISEVLKQHGYNVISKDLIQREYPLDGTWDFLLLNDIDNPYSIVTNVPYKFACEFIEKAIEISAPNVDIWSLLKLQFLEGNKRRARLFDKGYLQEVDVFSKRVLCAKNGKFEEMKAGGGSAVAYGFFRFNSQRCDNPIIKWIN